MTALPPMQQVPHNVEAEQALLGVLLCNNGVIDDAFELNPEHFYHEAHRAIFAAIYGGLGPGDLVILAGLPLFATTPQELD